VKWLSPEFRISEVLLYLLLIKFNKFKTTFYSLLDFSKHARIQVLLTFFTKKNHENVHYSWETTVMTDLDGPGLDGHGVPGVVLDDLGEPLTVQTLGLQQPPRVLPLRLRLRQYRLSRLRVQVKLQDVQLLLGRRSVVVIQQLHQLHDTATVNSQVYCP
jgi:hypothetical protein